MAEELLAGSPWGFGFSDQGGQPVTLAMTHGCTVELLEKVFPIFTYQHGAVRVKLLVFAPQVGLPSVHNPMALLVVVQVQNAGKKSWDGSLFAPNLRDVMAVNSSNGLATPAESPHPRFTEHPVPIKPGYEAVVCLEGATWNPGCPEVRLALRSGEERVFAFGLLLGKSAEELMQTGQQLRDRPVLEWLNETANGRIQRYGELAIPADPYYSENYARFFESASSAILYSADETQFAGGPSGYSDFALALFEPNLLRPTVLARAGFKRRPPGHPAWEGLNDSLAVSVGDLCAMALYYRMTGDRLSFQQNPGLLAFAEEMLADILGTRRDRAYLFPSKRLWDGPARGDYHTGSNIMVWLAYSGMARLAKEVWERPELGNQWTTTAQRIREDIFRHCVGDSPVGRRFFEGANADGTFIPGHDSEEAFTTLAPFFGFCEPDEPALVNHAKLAFTPDNPLYEPAVDGIWWDARGTSWSGTSMPGQMAMLAGVRDEQELLNRLQQVRAFTDVDGSLWWWPYLYPCNNREKVRRREWPSNCSKCSYAAAIYLCQFVHNILGLQVDVPARQVAFRPFSPWPEFRWDRARLGWATFDVQYRRLAGRITGSITNLNRETYEGIIELMLPPDTKLAGRAPDNAVLTMRFGRPAVRLTASFDPGNSLALEFALEQ